MKIIKLTFLFMLTISAFTCCDKENIEPAVTDMSLSDSQKDVFLKKKGHWGTSNNRVNTHNNSLEDVYFESSPLAVKFKNEIEELTLYIKDSDEQVIFEDIISAKSNSSYAIPVSFIQNKKYYLEITYYSEDYYLGFTIQ